MKEVTFLNKTPADNLKDLKAYMNIDPLTLREVSIKYNLIKGLPDVKEIDYWPVKLVFLDSKGKFVIIRFYSYTVGNAEQSTKDFAKMLVYLGIDFAQEDIFTKNKADRDGNINLQYEVM